MTVKSLAQVAQEYLPPDWTDGERWRARRLNRGELRGVRFGRKWVMRDSDIEFMLAKYSNEPEERLSTPERQLLCVADGLSHRSRRRLEMRS